MRKFAFVGVLLLASAGVYSAQQAVSPEQLKTPPPKEPAWAFPVQQGSLAPDPGPKKLAGSDKTYTPEEIDNLMAPPDWLPNDHPPAPSIVTKGHGGALACGSCHLMSGIGHPESADVAGMPETYVKQQMMDFKSGARVDIARMNGIAKEMSDQEIAEVSAWFAAQKPRKNNRVVEAEMAPKTIVAQGRMRFVDPAGGMEPIGNRIITLPDQPDRARLRDPNSPFTAYAPPGSLAKGKVLVETGGGKSVACTLCHGMELHGQGGNPRLAGLHPVYTVRQLQWFKHGTRKGTDASLMQLPVSQLTDEDILNIAAYLGSLTPGDPPK